MNRLLARQLRRVGIDPDAPPADAERWTQFLERVGASYEEADRSRYLLERAIELSSTEMLELTRTIQSLMSKKVERSELHYRTLFHQLPVGAIEEDFTRVAAYLDSLRAAGVDDLEGYFAAHPSELDVCMGMVDVVDCNRAVADLLDMPDRAMLIGPFDPRGTPLSAYSAWERQFLAIWRGERKVIVDFTGRRFDGSELAVNLHWLAAEYDGAVDYGRVMVVLIDISDREANERHMRDLVRSKDEFLASVSHELRTPLTSVVGYADLLREEIVDPSERATMLATIAEQASDLSNIVEDLLVGARSELGQLGVHAEEVDVVEQIVALQAASGSILPRLSAVEAPDGPVIALADPVRVRQILRNLVSNAARYGGARLVVRVGSDGEHATIAVCDDGPALAAEVAERIFDRYYRDRHSGEQPGSVGIGLTISRDLARLMGGDLTYRHDGEWSIFELSLPGVRAEKVA